MKQDIPAYYIYILKGVKHFNMQFQRKLLSFFLVLAMMISSLPSQPHVLYAEESEEPDVIEVLNETEQEDDEIPQTDEPVLEEEALKPEAIPDADETQEDEGTYVAYIGETGYASLVEAVNAAESGDTITMVADETIDVSGYAITVPSGKSITLDLNGKTVIGSCTEAGTSALIRNLGTLTINDSTGNGKLVGGADPTWTWDGSDDYSGSYASNTIRNEGALTVNGGTVYNASNGSAVYAIDNYGSGKVTINGGTIDAKKASAIRMFYCNGGSITVTDGNIGHYNSDEDYSYMGIQVMGGTDSDVTVTGGTIAGEYALYSNGTGESSVNISGGTFDGYVGFAEAGPDENHLSISGGTFLEWVGCWGDQAGFISGGTFASDVSDYLAEGLEQNEKGEVIQKTLVVEVDPLTATYDGSAKNPTVTVKFGHTATEALVEGTDYTSDGWKDASGNAVTELKNVGKYTYSATGIGSYAGQTASAEYEILPQNARLAIKSVTAEDKTFTGSPVSTTFTFTGYDNNVIELVEGSDYDVTYSNNINAGEASARITYKGNLEGSDLISFNIEKADISKVTITLSPSSYVLGNAEPAVTVKLGSYVLPLSEYSFAFGDMSTAGTGTVTVTSKGVNLTDGTKEKTFTISNSTAAITKNGTTTYYSNLKTAISAAATGDTIELIADYSGADFISYSNKALTIDLAGHSYTRSNSGAVVQVSSKASLTLLDSVGGGSFNAANGIGIETKAATATVTIESGAVTGSTTGISSDNGTVVINGGTVTGNSREGIRTQSGNITVNGGTVTGTVNGILEYENNEAATITVTGGTIKTTGTAADTAGIYLSDATALTVENAEIIGGHSGIAVFDAANVTINSGSVTGNVFGVSGNGSEGLGAYVVNVKGGSITGTDGAAIYHPNNGTVSIEDGTLSGPTAVYQKSGTLNISGGTFHATGAASEYAYNGNGINPTGEALVIDNCGYPGGAPAPLVNGGTFISDNASPVGSYAYGEGNEAVGGFVSDGIFYGIISDPCLAEGKELVLLDEAENKYGVQDATVHVTVSEGNYVFTGSAIEPELTVKLGTVVTDEYTVEYSDNVNAGECTVTVTIGTQTGTAAFTIEKADFADVTISLDPETYVYGNASVYEPTATVKFGEYTLNAEEYSVTYADNTEITDNAKAVITPANINFKGDARTVTFTIKAAAVKLGDTYFTSLQETLDAAHELTGEVTVELLADITEVAVIHQKAGLDLILEGNENIITGQLYIDGDGRYEGTDTLTIQNLKFAYDPATYDDAFIDVPNTKTTGKPYTTGKYNYSHNTTVKNCEFTGEGTTTVAFRVASGSGSNSITLDHVKVNGGHSFAQLVGVRDLTITDCEINGTKNGINISGGAGTGTISNTILNADSTEGYTVRLKDACGMEVSLSGNTFSGGEGLVNSATSGGKIIVVDGKYVGPLPTDPEKILIKGGLFSVEPDVAVCDENLYPMNNLDEETKDTYPYAVGTAVASVNGVNYATFEEAAAARESDEDVITLLSNGIGKKFTFTLDSIDSKLSVKREDGATVSTSSDVVVTKGENIPADSAEMVYKLENKNADGVRTWKIRTFVPVVEYTNKNGVVSYYETLSGSTTSTTTFSSDGTYKLLADISVNQRINTGALASNVVLDLNGHTLTSNATDCAILLSRAGTASSHKTFAIIDSSEEKGGKLVVNPAANLALQVSGKYNDITIGEGVTIEGEGIALLSENQTLNIYGKIDGGNDFAVSTNGGTTKNPVINIYEGAVLESDEIAVYLPSGGTTTISGGTITGTTAVYQKSGTLNISGGTLHATGAAADYAYNGNGAYSTGDALVVDNCGYPGGTPVTAVSGGTFISDNAKPFGFYAYGEGNEPISEYIALEDGESFYVNKELGENYLPDGYVCILLSEGEHAGLYEVTLGYTVSFDTNGGTPATMEDQKVAKGEKATKPADPAMDGYSFAGWYLGEEAFDFDTVITDNITLKAHWSLNVAKIGDTFYPTLPAAFAAAQAGDTIVLLTDTEIETIVVDRQIILDLNGHEASSDSSELFVVSTSGDLTITGNGKITGPANGEAFDGEALIRVEGGKLTVENGTLTATGSGSDGMYGVYVLKGGTAVFGNEEGGPTVTAHFAAIGTNNTTAPATIIVNGGTYTANAVPANNEWWYYFCAPVYAAANGTYTFNGGMFKGYYGLSSRYADTDQDITLNNVTIEASSGIDVFIDSQTGSTNTPDRHIQSSDNTLTLPEAYLWKPLESGMYEAAEPSVMVTFDPDNGNDAVKVEVIKGKKVEEPAAPSNGEFVFIGWYNGDTEFDFDTELNEDVNLKAWWKTTVIYNVDGAVTELEAIYHQPTPTIDDPTKENYVFDGWLKSGAEEKGVDETVEAAKVLYIATWKGEEKIVVYADGLGNVLEYYMLNYGDDTPAFTGTLPTREGFHLDEEHLWTPEVKPTVTSDMAYELNWLVDMFTVKFVSDGEEVERRDVAYGRPVSAPDEIVKENYVFLGWYYTVDGVEKLWEFETDTVKSDLVLTAKWASCEWELTLPFTEGTLTETGAYFSDLILEFYPADPSIGRTKDGYWVGVKFIAPEVITEENVDDATFTYNGGETWLSFADANDGQGEDGRYYLEAWVILTEEEVEELLAAQETKKTTFTFTWNGNRQETQSFLIEIDPSNILLIKDGEIQMAVEDGVIVEKNEYYTVTFDANGGSQVDPQSVKYNQKAVRPEDPNRDSANFLGWFLGEEEYDFDTPVTGDIVLIAKWEEVDWGDVLPEDRPYFVDGDLWITPLNDMVYDGTAKKPEFRVYHGTKLLTEGTDYSVKYSNNKNAADKTAKKAPTVTVTGKGNYNKKTARTFSILPAEANENNTVIILNKDAFPHTGKVQKPTVSVEFNGKKLKNNKDYVAEFENPNSADEGTYKITVKFSGNCKGSMETVYRIAKNIVPVSKLSISGIKALNYTGEELTQALTVKEGTKVLEKDRDYTVSYRNNVNAGTAYVTITGMGGYTGSVTKSFKINPVKLTAANTVVTGMSDSVKYHGVTTFDLTVKLAGQTAALVENKDYTVTYKNNAKVGKAAVTIKGIGNYSGSFNKNFQIEAISLNDVTIVQITDQPYQKGGNKPDISAYDSYNDAELKLNKDYTLTYSNNNAIGTATVTVKGKGNYTGSKTLTFKIEKAPLSALTVTALDKVYSGKKNAYKTTVTVTDLNGKKLSGGKDYDKNVVYTYKEDTLVIDLNTSKIASRAAGSAVQENDVIPAETTIIVTVTALGNYSGTATAEFRIVKSNISKASVKVPNQTYTGKPVTLKKEDLTVKVGKEILKPEDFEIVSYSNNTNKGSASVVIKGVGNYGGTKTVKFKIVQKSFLEAIWETLFH